MRIVHISDLHFGKHQPLLMNELKARVRELKPRLIVCSGDVADDTAADPTHEAQAFLTELTSHCVADPGDNGPRLIVVPGNHDMRKKGWLYRALDKHYAKAFGDEETDYYFEKDNVWVFGFDSAAQGTAGGSGFVSDDDLQRFNTRYNELVRTPGFEHAFKIVVVHHHPLPVNWDHDGGARWLTMTNAGKFLSAVLFRRIDLVLHGHEHLQARARLWSTLGANNHQTTVISLGATLRRVDAPDRNWFGVLDIDASGVKVGFHGSIGGYAFNTIPEGETFWIRSPQATDDQAFERWRTERGLFYRAVASLTLIDHDGDSRRWLEFEDLTFTREPGEWDTAVPLTLPHSAGYLDKLQVAGQRGPRVVRSIPAESELHDFSTFVAFNQRPVVNDPTDFSAAWHSLNSYAMDRRQFDHMYKGETDQPFDNIEFTHYVVNDPIEQLTVVARFPEGFVPERPRLRVAQVRPAVPTRQWPSVSALENALAEEYALRYYPSIHIAALRVRRPKQGLSYGIQWDLPDPPRRAADTPSIQMDQVLAHLKTPADAPRAQVAELLRLVVATSRELLMKERRRTPWPGTVEASLMIFDEDSHCLRVVAALTETRGKLEILDYSHVTFDYGDGIAGRAFKTNQVRVYVRDDRQSDGPKHYRQRPDLLPHAVLVSFPVQAPADDRVVWPPYGVLNIGSTRLDCPLRLIQPDRSEWKSRLNAFKEEADLKLHQTLAQIFLDDDPSLTQSGGEA